MSAGKIKQVEQASMICQEPSHVLVASFMGSPVMNLLRGKFVRKDRRLCFARDSFFLPLSDDVMPSAESEALSVVLGIRPDAMRLTPPGGGQPSARVVLVESRGPAAALTVETCRQSTKIVVPTLGRPDEGAEVGLSIDLGAVVIFGGDGGGRLRPPEVREP
jgi:multiple sugar transport system ATP-binding protein